MLKVFIDTDVILDYLINRKPHSLEAAKILTLSETGEIRTYISALTIANCYYIIKKLTNHKNALQIINKLCGLVEIIDLKKNAVIGALSSDFNDYEDALQNETAKCEKEINILITRNIKDYKYSTLKVMTPKMFLKAFKDNQLNM